MNAKDLPRDLLLLILRHARLSIDQRHKLGITPGSLSVPRQLRDDLTAVFGRLHLCGCTGGAYVKLKEQYRLSYRWMDAYFHYYVVVHNGVNHGLGRKYDAETGAEFDRIFG